MGRRFFVVNNSMQKNCRSEKPKGCVERGWADGNGISVEDCAKDQMIYFKLTKTKEE